MASNPNQTTRSQFAAFVVCFSVAATIVALAVSQHPEISDSDEAIELHYSYELGRGRIVGPGDPLSPAILDEIADRGFPSDPERCVACDSDVGFDRSPDPTLYHAVAAAGAAMVRAASPIESFVTAARLVGVLWLGAGLFVFWSLLAELGVRGSTSLIVVLAVAIIPVVVDASATVDSGGASLLAGSAIAVTALRHVHGRGSARAVAGVCAVASLLGPALVCGAVLASLLLIGHARRERRLERPWRHAAATALALPLVFVVAVIGWNAADPVGATSPLPGLVDSEQQAPDRPTREGGLASDVTALIPMTEMPTSVPPSGSPLLEPWEDLTNLMIAGAPFYLWLLVSHDEKARFAGLVVASLVAGALSIAALHHLRSTTGVTAIEPTEGLALLPPAAACVAVLVDRTGIGRIGAGAVTACAAVVLVGELGGIW